MELNQNLLNILRMTDKNNGKEDGEPSPKPSPTPRARKKKSKTPSKLDKKDAKYKIIRAALEEHLIEHARRHDKKKRSLDQVTSHVEEFLDSFIILGYDYTGEPVTLISANTQQQADSLSTMIQKFIASTQSGPPHGGFYE